MKIEAFILAYNEAETIGLTIKHYQQFCERVVIFDNFSTDETRDIALSMGCDVRLFGVKGVLSDKEYLKVKNHCWKQSKADWVIVCDADEILWHPDLTSVLLEDCTIMTTYGWNVYSEDVPRENWLEITTGVPDCNYSKLVCFNPKAIQEINYVYGCHLANPKGNIQYSNTEYPLFHYKHIGGAKRVADRHALYAQRMSENNKRWKLGYQYLEPREQTIKYFNENLSKAVPYVGK